MDTKSNRRKEKVNPPPVPICSILKIDDQKISVLEEIEYRSIIISTIIHTIVLLLLAMIVCVEVPAPAPVLYISFTESSETDASFLEVDNLVSLESFANNIAEEVSVSENTPINTIVEPVSINIEEPVTNDAIDPINDQPIPHTDLLLTEIVASSKSENTVKEHLDKKIDAEESVDNILSGLISLTQAGIASNNRSSSTALSATGPIGNSDFMNRLSKAGAQTGDVQISIAWNTIDDIDLHITVSTNGLLENINWVHRIGQLTQGVLDVDMNAHNAQLIPNPVENVFWQKGSSPTGIFNVYIHYYRSWSGNRTVPVVIRVKNGENTQTFNVIAILGRSPQPVTHFTRP